jgi:hypothetical protein
VRIATRHLVHHLYLPVILATHWSYAGTGNSGPDGVDYSFDKPHRRHKEYQPEDVLSPFPHSLRLVPV